MSVVLGHPSRDCAKPSQCIAELQDHAEFSKQHQFVSAIDATATVFKSDTLVDNELQTRLRSAVSPLENVLESMRDWHPGSDGKVLDLVHPSLYPLLVRN